MKTFKRYIFFLVELLILSGCLDIGIGFAEDDPDLCEEILSKPENQYELTDTVAYVPGGFYRRVPANGETFDWYSLSQGTTGGISGKAKGNYFTETITENEEHISVVFVFTEELCSLTDSMYSISKPILMDDGSVCYTKEYLSEDDFSSEYERQIWIYNSQVGEIYSRESSSDGSMGGSYSEEILLNCSFSKTSVGKLLNEYYAKQELPLKEL